MKLTRYMAPVAGAIVMASFLAACGGSAATTAPAATTAAGGEAPYIAIVSKGSQHQFWQAVQKGATDEAAKLGATISYEGPASESEVDKQLTMLQTALDKKPAAICFAALDSKAATPLLEKAKAAGIPVVGFDSGVDSEIPVTTVTTDNIAAAGEAADQMAKLIGDAGKVAVIVHDQTSRTGIDRRDGFVKAMEEKHPNIEVVAIEYGAGDPVKSGDLAKAIMTANPDLKGFFGANEGSIKGILNSLKETGKSDIVAIGYDSGEQQITAINDGTEAGAITQNPIGIGAKCVSAAMDAIAGKSMEKIIDTGYYWYDKTNIENPEIQAVLYK